MMIGYHSIKTEIIQPKKIRFRTLGCYPLTGAIESEADDLASIILELLCARTSERQGRAIDSDSSASMGEKARVVTSDDTRVEAVDQGEAVSLKRKRTSAPCALLLAAALMMARARQLEECSLKLNRSLMIS